VGQSIPERGGAGVTFNKEKRWRRSPLSKANWKGCDQKGGEDRESHTVSKKPSAAGGKMGPSLVASTEKTHKKRFRRDKDTRPR